MDNSKCQLEKIYEDDERMLGKYSKDSGGRETNRTKSAHLGKYIDDNRKGYMLLQLSVKKVF